MKVKTGMSGDEIISMFGNPKAVRSTTCGGKTFGSWQCVIWSYDSGRYSRSYFYFQKTGGELVLNNFDIDRD